MTWLKRIIAVLGLLVVSCIASDVRVTTDGGDVAVDTEALAFRFDVPQHLSDNHLSSWAPSELAALYCYLAGTSGNTWTYYSNDGYRLVYRSALYEATLQFLSVT